MTPELFFPETADDHLRISQAGSRAVLIDAGKRQFCLATQRRFWAMAAPDSELRSLPWFKDCVLGVNNLLVIYDPIVVDQNDVSKQLRHHWKTISPLSETGAVHEVSVHYDVSEQSDLIHVSEHAGLSVDEVVRLHSSAEYFVACVGSMPGFGYLVGLPPALAVPRRATPRASIPQGSVVIGGSQTGILPCTAPSGWHVIGSTGVSVFDPLKPNPSLFAPGDRVKFAARGVSR